MTENKNPNCRECKDNSSTGQGYPNDRSFSSCSVLEVIGSHWPQYFKFVMLKTITKELIKGKQYISLSLIFSTRLLLTFSL